MADHDTTPATTRGHKAQDPRRGRVNTQALERLFDRPPPHSLDAEQSLLGSLLLDPSMFGDVIALVFEGSQFYSTAHATLFEAMKSLYDQTGSVDIVQVGELMRDKDMLELTGGEDYLVELAQAVPSAAAAVRYARIVANKARLRRLIDAASDILYDALHAQAVTDDETDLIVDSAEQKIFDIASAKEKAGTETLKKLINAEFDRIEKMAESGQLPGVPTGYTDLDELTAGLQPGELLILAARPSMGKTALALNLAEQVALGGRTPWSPRTAGGPSRPVAIFSLEMSREALVQRLLSSRSGVPSEKMRAGHVGKPEWDKLQEAAAVLYEAPIYIDDTPALTALQLRARARRMRERYDLSLIVIDYLQLLTAPHAARESRQVEVATISRQIKALARELRLPIVCLAQLNRGTEQRERNRPRMSDLRESGSIEQDADVVMLLHREAYYHRGEPEWDPKSPAFDPENEDKLNLAELIIAKQRNGPTGTVHLTWDDRITRFKNHDPNHPALTSHGGYSPPAGPKPLSGYASPQGPSPYQPSQYPAQHAAHHPSTQPAGPPAGPPAGRIAASTAAPQPAAGRDQVPSTLNPSTHGLDPSDPARSGYRSAFAPPRPTGPIEDHRDGGGPDRPTPRPPAADDDDDEPPF